MSGRKYRQNGYQDDGASERRGPRGGKRPQQDGPRGRGLGAPTKSVMKCARCGAKAAEESTFDAVCASCGSDLYTCTNCRHFDTSAANECRKPVEVRIAAKAKRNECGLFESKLVQEFEKDAPAGGSKADAKAAFDDLFNF